MSKAIGLIGQVFGRLRVVDRHPPSPGGFRRWRCECSCGTEYVTYQEALRSGKKTSCGCATREGRFSDLAGKTFGGMRVLALAKQASNARERIWRVLASCGHEREIEECRLRSNPPSACGPGCTVQRFVLDGKAVTLKELAVQARAKESTIAERIRRGWSPIEAVVGHRNDRKPVCKVLVDYQGESVSIRDLARKHGLKTNELASRLRLGWPIERALSEPVERRGLIYAPGDTFGRLTIVGEAPSSKKGARRYSCRCICGETIERRQGDLRRGERTSCGCDKPRRKFVDLTGQVFGHLTVLRRESKKWVLGCVCGNETMSKTTWLLTGKRTSCGAASCGPSRERRLRRYGAEDLHGQRFGRLVVESSRPRAANRRRRWVWICRCDCGNKVERDASALRQSKDAASCGDCRAWILRVGQRHGHLEIVSVHDRGDGEIVATCRCDCGGVVSDKRASNLFGTKHPPSCGCHTARMRRERAPKYLHEGEFLTLLEVATRTNTNRGTLSSHLRHGASLDEAIRLTRLGSERKNRRHTLFGVDVSVTQLASILGVTATALPYWVQRGATAQEILERVGTSPRQRRRPPCPADANDRSPTSGRSGHSEREIT